MMKKNTLFSENNRLSLFLSVMLVFSISFVNAQSFPYDAIPLTNGAFNNTVSINTTSGTSPFNNLLLGSNVDFNTSIARVLLSRVDSPSGRMFNQGFNALNGQEFIAKNDPVVIRFPQGVFGNTYHWERVLDSQGQEIAAADSRHIIDPFVIGTRVISQHDSPTSVRIGYPSLRGIFDTAASNGKPLDLLTILSIIGNDADSNGRRWQSMIDDGHDVRDMELGNEFFFRSQRSGTINTEAQWVARARQVVANIKNRANGLSRTVRFGIPISFRGGDPSRDENNRIFHQNYNDMITVDESFFDAIVVHRYVDQQTSDGVRPEDLTAQSVRDLLTASRIMDQSLTYCKTQVSANKDAIWLTEWGVSGSEDKAIGASFLGTADIYSHIITNNDRLEVERVNWFSAVGANAQYTVSGSNTNVIIGTTGYGDVYGILRDNLRDSNMFNDVTVTSPSLRVDGIAQDAKSVHVLATRRSDGTPRFIITNKTNEMARIFVDRDGDRENSINYISNGVRWESLGSTVSIPFSDQKSNVNAILIPPYSVIKVDMSFGVGTEILSVNDIEIVNNEKSVVLYPNPTSTSFNIALTGIVSANVVITDVLGKVVYSTKVKSTNLQIETAGVFKTGIYIIQVTDENNQSYFKKLVVK